MTATQRSTMQTVTVVNRPWTPLSSHAVVIARDDIDTDQIIPARFLTTTSRTGLGRHLFSDWRFDASGAPRKDFALSDWGIRAVIASSFADIFRSNAHKNGLLTIALEDAALAALHASLLTDPSQHIIVDLPTQCVSLPTGVTASFSIDSFSKHCLLDGVDELGSLVAELPAIAAWEAACER